MAFASVALLWARPVDPASGALLNASGLAGSETRRFVFLFLPGLFLALAFTKVALDMMGTGSDLAEGIRNLVLIVAAGWAVGRTLTNLAKSQAGLEEQVRLRTAQLRTALEGAGLGQWQFDLATEMMLVDEGTARILGDRFRAGVPFPVAEWRALVHPDDRPGAEGVLAVHLADTSRRFGIQYRLRHRDGSWRWVEVKGQAFVEPDGGAPRQIIGIVADVTERRALEDQLRESETKLRLSLDAASLGLYDYDLASERLWLGEGAFRLLGLPLRDPPFLPVAEYQALIHPDDHAASAVVIQRHMEDPLIPIDHEYRIRRPDGSWGWIHSRGRGMHFNGTAAPSRLMGVLADATARKALEAAAVQHRKDLETLLYVASHDLREPLRAIENFAQIVRNEYADRLDDRGRDFLDRVVRAAVRLHQLLEELQGVAKAQGAGLDLHRVAGATLADEVLGRMEHRARELRASITVADGLPDLLVDATWATQALYNLVANACKFTPRGIPPVVEVAGLRQGGQVGFTVSDRGLGVPEEIRESIFELFRRGVGREVEGTGAGLAIVQQVATRHGGRAWVEPREGGGSIFYVTFGAAPTKEAA
jgi:PAS domain S-box-containing protein